MKDISSKGTKRTEAALFKKEKHAQELDRILNSKIDEHLVVEYREQTGRSIIATKIFHANELLAEYTGELISHLEGEERELRFKKSGITTCFSFFFKFNGKSYCIDASREQEGKCGRIFNHGRPGNVKPIIYNYNGLPKIVFRATRKILKGEEITYDYGDRENMHNFPWLKARQSATTSGVKNSDEMLLNNQPLSEKESKLYKRLSLYFESVSKENAIKYLSHLKLFVRSNEVSPIPLASSADFSFVISFTEIEVDKIGRKAIETVYSEKTIVLLQPDQRTTNEHVAHVITDLSLKGKNQGTKDSPQRRREIITDYFSPIVDVTKPKPSELKMSAETSQESNDQCLILGCKPSSSYLLQQFCHLDSIDISRIVNNRWLNNNIINSFCYKVLERSSNKRNQFVGCGELLLNQNGKMTLTRTGYERLKKITASVEALDSVVTVTSINESHFVLWVCCLRSNTIYLLDSKRELNISKNIQNVFLALRASFQNFLIFQSFGAKYVNIKVPQQGVNDSQSCGVAVCYYYDKLVNGHKLSDMMNLKPDFVSFRLNILKTLNSTGSEIIPSQRSLEIESSNTSSGRSTALDGTKSVERALANDKAVTKLSNNHVFPLSGGRSTTNDDSCSPKKIQKTTTAQSDSFGDVAEVNRISNTEQNINGTLIIASSAQAPLSLALKACEKKQDHQTPSSSKCPLYHRFRKYPLTQAMEKYKRFSKQEKILAAISNDYNIEKLELKKIMGYCKTGKSFYEKFINMLRVVLDVKVSGCGDCDKACCCVGSITVVKVSGCGFITTKTFT